MGVCSLAAATSYVRDMLMAIGIVYQPSRLVEHACDNLTTMLCYGGYCRLRGGINTDNDMVRDDDENITRI